MNVREQYEKCIKQGYAMGAFNFVNLDMLKAILKGAENQNSPVICRHQLLRLTFWRRLFASGFAKGQRNCKSSCHLSP